MIPSFPDYERQARAAGFDEVLERVWPADTVVPDHTHPFALEALVVEGEMWLTVGSETFHLLPGATFELEANQPHAERYGPAGAIYWVARRN